MQHSYYTYELSLAVNYVIFNIQFSNTFIKSVVFECSFCDFINAMLKHNVYISNYIYDLQIKLSLWWKSSFMG